MTKITKQLYIFTNVYKAHEKAFNVYKEWKKSWNISKSSQTVLWEHAVYTPYIPTPKTQTHTNTHTHTRTHKHAHTHHLHSCQQTPSLKHFLCGMCACITIAFCDSVGGKKSIFFKIIISINKTHCAHASLDLCCLLAETQNTPASSTCKEMEAEAKCGLHQQLYVWCWR